MKPETAILVGGIYNIGFVIFHLMFWKLLHWNKDLASLSFINRQVMQIFNLCLIFVFLIFAYISLFHTGELLRSGLGKTLLLLMAIFWLLRAIEQIYFFGLRNKGSAAFFGVFFLGAVFYFYPFFMLTGE